MKISQKDLCTGCSACAATCPVGAINMLLNEEGFYEPQIDNNTCINCKKCIIVCPSNCNDKYHMIDTFYGWHRRSAERDTSSSGGVFRALSDKVLSDGGIIYAATFSHDYKDVFFMDSDHIDIINLQKSKYIVSNPDGIFGNIKEMLVSKRKVLFCAAPCQIAGFMKYLGNERYDNLITVDFVCGGMPSVAFWHEHVDYLEEKYNSSIDYVDFRSKKNGWGKLYLDIRFKNGKKRICREYVDSYYNCFMSGHVSVRRTCLQCKFHDLHYSDITVADFWGYRNAGINMSKEGLSLILVNTELGLLTVNQSDMLEKCQLNPQYAMYAIEKLNTSETELKNRADFFSLAKVIGFEKAAKKLYPPTVYRHLLKFLKNRIGL